MIVDIILGNNIDTLLWISELKEIGADHILVIDYDLNEAYIEKDKVIYTSPIHALEYVKQFDTLNFYKSMYAYPGMNGTMSSLYKKKG